MKEKFKRLFASIAAIILALGMMGANAIPAMAADPEYSITIRNTNNRVSIDGKTYYAYKVFDLTLGNETTTGEGENAKTSYGAYSYTIKNTDWAWNTLVSGITAASDGSYTTNYGLKLIPTGNNSPTYTVDKNTMTEENARSLADDLTSVINSTTKPVSPSGTAVATNETAVINLSSGGYYAVYGTATSSDGSRELTAAIGLTTTDKTPTVAPKVDAPTLDKKITGVSDGDEDTNLTDNILANGKAATASVGDTVNFELSSVVPDLTGYSNYTYTIEDTLSSGLNFVASNEQNSNIVVKIGDTPLTNTAAAISGTGTKGEVYVNVDSINNKLTIQIPYASLAEGSKGTAITVTYSATVNNNALSYNYDMNTATLKYSNNPSDSSKTDTTPKKNTYVVNININVVKRANNENGATLAGAKFKLYKIINTKNLYYKWDDTSNKPTWIDESTSESKGDEFITGNDGTLYTIDNTTGKASSTKASFNGLDVGTYHLVETAAPDGYNRLDDAIPVVISASIPTGTDTNAGKVVLSATVNNQTATITDGVVDITAKATTSQPVASATVINNSGSVLPSTGGIGTTIFYVIGGVVVAGAVILLLARRRKNA